MRLKADLSRCVQCGLCFGVCPELSAEEAEAKSFQLLLKKCSLCAGLRRLRCVDACPHNALLVEYDEGEEAELAEAVGWRKRRPQRVFETLETGAEYEVVEADGGLFLLTRLEELSLEEARLAREVLEAFRASDEAFDAEVLAGFLESLCVEKGVSLSEGQIRKILDFVESEAGGLSVLDFFLKLPRLEEIVVVNEKTAVFAYHEAFGWLETDVVITSRRKIGDLANRIARGLGRRLTFKTPSINACLSFGRLHAAIPPAAVSGPCITLRRFRQTPFTLRDFVENKTLSPEAAAFLKLAAMADLNILIAGNTASGKTSILNTLASFIPRNQRVVIVEETPEVVLPHKNQVRLVAGDAVRMNELITDTLRMRPDRLIIGEVRSAAEAKALANTLLAGQGKGLFATMHAESTQEALQRLERLGFEPAELNAIDLVVVTKRWTRRATDIRRITEICGAEKPGLARIFEYDAAADRLRKTKADAKLFEKITRSLACGREDFSRILEKERRNLESA